LKPRKWEVFAEGGKTFAVCYFAIVSVGLFASKNIDWYVLWGVLPALISAFGKSAIEFVPLISAFRTAKKSSA
jgi:hypothetical protein